MDTFHIDRQFGVPIWVDVENGIVIRCYNETPKFNQRMNELYKGKSIAFLKEDFESRMRPTYHRVKPNAWVDVMQKINAVKSKLRAVNINLTVYEITAELREELNAIREALTLEESGYTVELAEVKKRLWEEHNYEVI